jgi:hypothetical protein
MTFLVKLHHSKRHYPRFWLDRLSWACLGFAWHPWGVLTTGSQLPEKLDQLLQPRETNPLTGERVLE